MQTSPQGVAFIAAFEGVITRAYRDVGGTWTIGVGHTAAAGPPVPTAGMTVTRDEAFAILARDLSACEARVAVVLPGVPQTVFDGAVSFEFNTGAIARASWVTAYEAGDRDGAHQALLLWNKAAGKTVAGLVRRREAEARLILNGDYGPDAGAVPPAVARSDPDTVRIVQTALSTLGFYNGAIDGDLGPQTTAAIRAYQASHVDLVVDGIAGPATQASLDRDLAARRQIGGPAAVGGVGGLIAAVAALVGAGHPLLPLVVAGAVLAVAAVTLIRHQADLARIFSFFRG